MSELRRKQQTEFKCPKGRLATVVCISQKCDHPAFCCQQANCCQKNIKTKCKLKKVQQLIKLHENSCLRLQSIYDSTLDFFQNIIKMVDNQIKNFKEWSQKSFTIRRVFDRNDSENMTAEHLSKIFEHINEYNQEYFQDISAYLKQWDKNLREQFLEMRSILCDKGAKKAGTDIRVVAKNLNQKINKNISLTTRIVWKQSQKDALLQIFNYLRSVLSVNLLFHAGSHQFSVSKFHQLCDGIPNTLVIIRNDKDKFYGGFSPMAWGKSKYQKFITDNQLKTFVFSLTHKKKYFLKEEQKNYAIEWNSLFGPIFGRCNMIQVWDKANKEPNYWEHIPFSFRPPHGEWTNEMYEEVLGVGKYQQFRLLDWEVFQVVFQ